MSAETTPPGEPQNLWLAAYWKSCYSQEKTRRRSVERTLAGERKRRDYYRNLAVEYEFQLGIRKQRLKPRKVR